MIFKVVVFIFIVILSIWLFFDDDTIEPIN